MRSSIPIFLLALSVLLPVTVGAADSAKPKKVVVVTTTLGFRHSSIPTAEKVLGDLAAKSGLFTVEYVHQPPNQPQKPKDASKEQEEAFRKAEAAWNDAMKAALAKIDLASTDGIIFANTTGDLPIPDRDKFLEWLKSGKAFIGMHSASDTFHGWPAFIEMLGGEFRTHGAQVGVTCIDCDREHAANKHLGATWPIKQEEVYLFKNYDPAKVHELLVLDKHPNEKTAGHFPISWCKAYGKGRVMYTALGHREDVWESEPYQKHILGGILWALGLAEGSAEPSKAAAASSN
jgi:uncharacterized protein